MGLSAFLQTPSFHKLSLKLIYTVHGLSTIMRKKASETGEERKEKLHLYANQMKKKRKKEKKKQEKQFTI